MDPTQSHNASSQQLLCQAINGQSPDSAVSKPYPAPTAQYDEVVQSPDLFWGNLKSFHRSIGTKFAIPTVGGRALDLHRLFVEVTSRGGLEKIIRERKWKEVIAVFNFPSTITSASFVLRKYYQSLLYHFEQVYYFHKEVAPLPIAEPSSGSLVNGSGTLEEGAVPAQGPRLQLGCTVLGSIDAKFDDGYMVTVNLGTSQLKGVLYHTPPILHMAQSESPTVPSRKRSRLTLRDPSEPKSKGSIHNFFFSEHYNKDGQERANREDWVTMEQSHRA